MYTINFLGGRRHPIGDRGKEEWDEELWEGGPGEGNDWTIKKKKKIMQLSAKALFQETSIGF
jgi:hypothetical protein